MKVVAKIGGLLLIALAVFQWMTFEYPNVNPFHFGAVFSSGMLAQALNWVIVCVLGAVGWLLLSLGANASVKKRTSVDSDKA